MPGTLNKNINYQMGLLHFAHLLISADGEVNEFESKALERVREEEGITNAMYLDFMMGIKEKSEKEIFEEGVRLLYACREEEKIAAIVHLFGLSEADNNFHKKEVRLLFYSLQVMEVDFEDVELSARMAAAGMKR